MQEFLADKTGGFSLTFRPQAFLPTDGVCEKQF